MAQDGPTWSYGGDAGRRQRWAGACCACGATTVRVSRTPPAAQSASHATPKPTSSATYPTQHTPAASALIWAQLAATAAALSAAEHGSDSGKRAHHHACLHARHPPAHQPRLSTCRACIPKLRLLQTGTAHNLLSFSFRAATHASPERRHTWLQLETYLSRRAKPLWRVIKAALCTTHCAVGCYDAAQSQLTAPGCNGITDPARRVRCCSASGTVQLRASRRKRAAAAVAIDPQMSTAPRESAADAAPPLFAAAASLLSC
jgi:hypothetical protein